MNVYPNPTIDYAVIDRSFTTNELQVFNSSGGEVTSEVQISKLTGKTKVGLSNLPAGYYFINHKKDNFVTRIVKR